MDNSEMFLVGHLKSEFDTTDLPSKRSVLSSVLYITRFSGKRLLQSAKDVTQMLGLTTILLNP